MCQSLSTKNIIANLTQKINKDMRKNAQFSRIFEVLSVLVIDNNKSTKP